MADETAIPGLSQRAAAQAAAKARRLKRAERREACFKFFVSGFSPHEIAAAMKATPASVRRLIDQAIRERRLDAPERYAQVQVARLSKALCLIDHRIERGGAGAVTPLIKLVAELDRYHGLDARSRRLVPIEPRRPQNPALPPAVPLALTHEPLAAAAEDCETAIVA